MTVEEAARDYWNLLQKPDQNYSHWVLLNITRQFGEAAVDKALEPLIEAERQQIQAREDAYVRKGLN